MGSRDHEEVNGQHPPSPGEPLHSRKCQRDHQHADDEREREGVEEFPVAEHMAVGNTEAKGDDIEVREQGAEEAQRPESQRHLLRRNGLSEGGSDKDMSEGRGHKGTKKTDLRREPALGKIISSILSVQMQDTSSSKA